MLLRVGLWVLGMAVLSACADEKPATPRAAWACPTNWVAAEKGGCGPAVLLCVDGGGAAAGACAAVDLARAPLIPGDGGGVRGFRRLPDGGIGGGWPEPGEPDGPPDATWSPEGVPAEDFVPPALGAGCTGGWQRGDDGTCSPALPVNCPAGSYGLPGGFCTHTAVADCPAGDYPDPGAEAVGMPRVHVRAGADASLADGSAERPYATLGEAVARGGGGAWVLVAAGEYREQVTIPAGEGRRVLGVCAARAVIRGPGPAAQGGEAVVVRGFGTSLDLRGVTVTGEGRGLAVGGGASLRLARVAVVANREHGVVAGGVGTRLEVTDCVVRGTRPSAQVATSHGVTAQGGASVTIQSTAIEANVDTGLLARGGHTAVEVRGSSVRGQTLVKGERGLGLAVEDLADLRVERSVIAGNAGMGVNAATGATLRVEGSQVRDNGAWGVAALAGARAVVQACLIEANASGVAAAGPETEFALSESVVRGSRGAEPARFGHGVDALDGAAMRVLGSAVAANVEAGVLTTGRGTRVEVEGSVVRETAPRAGDHGDGIQASGGAAVSVLRSRVVGNASAGVQAIDPGSEVELRDAVVERTRPPHVGGVGRGLVATGQATLRATGVLVADNLYAGAVSAAAGTRLALQGCVVRGTRPAPLGQTAIGLLALDGAGLQAERCTVADNTYAGVYAEGGGTAVALARSVVRGPREAPRSGQGHGIDVGERAKLQATGLVVEGCVGVGVFTFAARTRVDLAESVVRGTRPENSGAYGDGIQVTSTSVLRADGVLVRDSRRIGLAVFDAGSLLHGADVLVLGVDPNDTGLGVGVYAAARGSALLQRLAVTEVAGAALAAVPYQEPRMLWDASRVTVADLYVRQVATSEVRLVRADNGAGAGSALVAHGLYVAPGCTLDADRAALDGGGYGFFNTRGTLRVNQASICGQRDAMGANDDGTPAANTTLIGAVGCGNANDAVVQLGRPPGLGAPRILPTLLAPLPIML